MSIFREIIAGGYEQVSFFHDPDSGLRAVIVIHNTAAGPALGGCRFKAYADEDEAVKDALRLARGMTYKNAAYKLPYGGGKAVIWQETPASGLQISGGRGSLYPGGIGGYGASAGMNEYARLQLFQALGRSIEGLGGRYITGLDLGTSVADMDAIRTQTEYVTDTTGSIMATDDFTAEMTAYGVYQGMRAAVQHRLNLPSLYDLRVLVQGLGKVGLRLCRYLYEDGARLLVSDMQPSPVAEAVRLYGAIRVSAEHVYQTSCDIFSPCALGAILDDGTIPQLRCSIVAGAANNQLSMERHGDLLEARGILYAPDFILNAGGIIITAGELQGNTPEELKERVLAVGDTMKEVLHLSDSLGIPPFTAARQLAENNLRELKA